MKCTFLYQDTCQSVVYNTDNQMCKPGSVAFGPLENVDTSIPVTGSNDMIFYTKQPIPPCDTNGNFALYKKCGTTVCLHLSSSGEDYYQAASKCSQMNSKLFFGNTLARFSVFLVCKPKLHKQEHLAGSDRPGCGRHICVGERGAINQRNGSVDLA